MIDVLTDLWEWVFVNISLDVCTVGVGYDSLTTVTVGIGVAMLSDEEVTALVAVVITLGFAVSLLCAVDVLAGVWDGKSIDADVMIDALACVFADTTTRVVIDVAVGVDMFTDASANAVMTALEFTMSSSLEE